MPAGLVIDNPAHALFINEGAINHDIDEPAFDNTGEPQLGTAFRMCRRQPASAFFADAVNQRLPCAGGSICKLLLTDTLRHQCQPDCRLQCGYTLLIPSDTAFIGNALQPAVHDVADVARRFTDPRKLDIVLSAHRFGWRRPCHWLRRCGKRPAGAQATQALINNLRLNSIVRRPFGHIAQCRLIIRLDHRPKLAEQRT